MAMVWTNDDEKVTTSAKKALGDSLYTPEIKEESIYLNPTEYLQHENIRVGKTKKIIEEMPLDELAKTTGFEDKKALMDAFNKNDPKTTLALKNYFDGEFGDGTFNAVLSNISKETLNEKRNNISWWNDERSLGEQHKQDGIGEVLNSLLFGAFGAIPQKLFQPSRDKAVQSGDFSTKNWDGSTGEFGDNFKPQDLLEASTSLAQAIPLGIGATAASVPLKLGGYLATNSAIPVAQEVADATLNERDIDPKAIAINSFTNMATPYVLNQAMRGLNKLGLGSLLKAGGEQIKLPSSKQVVKDAEKVIKEASKESSVKKAMGHGLSNERVNAAKKFIGLSEQLDKGLQKNIDEKVLKGLSDGQKWTLYKALKDKGALDAESMKYMEALEGKLKAYEMFQTLAGNKVGDNISSTEEGRKKVVSPLPVSLQNMLLDK